MPLLNTRGERLTKNDIQALTSMLEGSLVNHIAYLTRCRKLETSEDVRKRFAIAREVYGQGLAGLGDRIRDARQGVSNIRLEDFIRDIFSSLARQTLSQTPDVLPGKSEFLAYVADQWGESEFIAETGHQVMLQQDTASSCQKHALDFTLATRPMAGVEQIAAWPPDRNYTQLYERSLNQSTSMFELILRREQILDDDTLDRETQKHKRRELQARIDAQRKKTLGLYGGAELTKYHIASMIARRDRITFGDLYNVLAEVNQAQDPQDPAAGKLRGGVGGSRGVTGVGASVLPVTLYRTLDHIADYMNQTRATHEPALRRTRAIQLAAYASQMLSSLHAFGIANGRTCRLFADTILQTFGLPPCTPQPEEKDFIRTMGGDMDLAGHAAIFLKGIRASDRFLQNQPDDLPEDPPPEQPSQYQQELCDLVLDILEEDRRYRAYVDYADPAHEDARSEWSRRQQLADQRREALFTAVFDPRAGLTQEVLFDSLTEEEQQRIGQEVQNAQLSLVLTRAVKEDGLRYSPLELIELPEKQLQELWQQHVTQEERESGFLDKCAALFRQDEGRFRQLMADITARLGDRGAAFDAFVRQYPGVSADPEGFRKE